MAKAGLVRAGVVFAAGALALTMALEHYAQGNPGDPLPPAQPPATSEGWAGVKQETELGQVRWMRDYTEARKRAGELGKPLCVLFDEVPG